MKLHIDIETYCDESIKDLGTHAYAAHPSFKIILFAYAFNDEPVTVIDTYHGLDDMPDRVMDALADEDVLLYAHNAMFERVCLMYGWGVCTSYERWRCTLIGASYLGLPAALDKVGKVLNLSEQKDPKGKALITYFSLPCKPTKSNGGRTVNAPEDNPAKWGLFKEYNGQDVRVEVLIDRYTDKYPGLSATELAYYHLDQRINDRGLYVDVPFVEKVVELNRVELEEVYAEMVAITGVENPASIAQLSDWFRDRGYMVPSFAKEQLADMLKARRDALGFPLDDEAYRVLELRKLASRSSSSKYATMLAIRNNDDRVRGLIQHYGAKTGRSAGRKLQPHNLKKTPDNGKIRKKAPHLIDDACEVGKRAIMQDIADVLYDDVPLLISTLIRCAIIAPPGSSLVPCDFSAIEARVLAWLAGEDWILQVFRDNIDLYQAVAANMFHLAIEDCGPGTQWRPRGKVAVLALGYQGAVNALIAMGALREGLTEAELPGIVAAYRDTIPKTTGLWKKLNKAAIHVVANKTKYTLRLPYTTLYFSYEKGYLFITLPSGRRLAYYGAHVHEGKLVYWGVDPKKKIWVRLKAYGGLLAENITQAVARDLLFDAMLRMEHERINLVLHVHDEAVAEVPDHEAETTLMAMENIMSEPPEWAKGLPIKGVGFVTKFYKKD